MDVNTRSSKLKRPYYIHHHTLLHLPLISNPRERYYHRQMTTSASLSLNKEIKTTAATPEIFTVASNKNRKQTYKKTQICTNIPLLTFMRDHLLLSPDFNWLCSSLPVLWAHALVELQEANPNFLSSNHYYCYYWIHCLQTLGWAEVVVVFPRF